ncbi:hypothetical protein [Nocardia brasiliensis]
MRPKVIRENPGCSVTVRPNPLLPANLYNEFIYRNGNVTCGGPVADS